MCTKSNQKKKPAGSLDTAKKKKKNNDTAVNIAKNVVYVLIRYSALRNEKIFAADSQICNLRAILLVP